VDAGSVDSIRIGLLEDDAVVAQMLEMAFAGSGWLCDRFETLTEIKQALAGLSYDLLVLDWMVPDGTVETLIPWVRERLGWEIPILIESLLGDEPRIVRALGLGANDYVVKPLRLAEVNARIQALLRRQQPPTSRILARGPYCIDTAQREVTLDGGPVKLTRWSWTLPFTSSATPGSCLLASGCSRKSGGFQRRLRPARLIITLAGCARNCAWVRRVASVLPACPAMAIAWRLLPAAVKTPPRGKRANNKTPHNQPNQAVVGRNIALIKRL
jgi:DNA-binding response OmpR family regulator